MYRKAKSFQAPPGRGSKLLEGETIMTALTERQRELLGKYRKENNLFVVSTNTTVLFFTKSNVLLLSIKK